MRKIKIQHFAMCCALLMGSCDLVEYHPYDVNITGKRGINAANCARIEEAHHGDTALRFAVISDTQRWYDDTEDAVAAINARNDIDFVLHCGDLSDFGATKEFLWMRDILEGFRVPYVCLLGNHDCIGTGKQTFSKVFGDPNFAFVAGNVRFICLNTNALEFDYSRPVPDFSFIKQQMDTVPPGVEKTIFVMHIAPFDSEFNNNVAYVFHMALQTFPQPLFSVYGHGHNVKVYDLFDDGHLYYECANVHKRTYLLFTIHTNGYDYEVVEF